MINLSGIAAKTGGKLPVPTRAPRESEKSKVPYAGKEQTPPLEALPADTIIDGVDCSGMTIDPKKGDIPAYLQPQNRQELTPEHKAKVDALAKELKNAEKAKKNVKKAPTGYTKAKAKAAAKTPKAAKTDGGVRSGSKLEIVAKLLKREKGCTTADILEATGWPSVSVPAMAKSAGLKLKKEKDGSVSHYYGS